jgi:hypothetical protein
MAAIGDLVARLSVDNSGFVRGLATAKGSLTSFAATTNATMTSIYATMAPIASAAVAIAAPLAAAWGGSETVKAYREAIQSQQKLATVLNNTGNASGRTFDQVNNLADSIERVTDFDADVIRTEAAKLAAFGTIVGDNFDRAIRASVDLSTVMGTDLTSSVSMIGKALNDPAAGIAKLAKAGITFTEQQREQIKVMAEVGDVAGAQGVMLDAIQRKFGGAAETMATPYAQLQRSIGDVGEMIGSVLAPSFDVIVDRLSRVLDSTSSASDAFREFGIDVATAMETSIASIELGATAIQLHLTRAVNDLRHVFGAQIPEMLKAMAMGRVPQAVARIATQEEIRLTMEMMRIGKEMAFARQKIEKRFAVDRGVPIAPPEIDEAVAPASRNQASSQQVAAVALGSREALSIAARLQNRPSNNDPQVKAIGKVVDAVKSLPQQFADKLGPMFQDQTLAAAFF